METPINQLFVINPSDLAYYSTAF